MPSPVLGREDPAAIHRFGEFELDSCRGVLLHHGVEIPLRPKSWELLRYLVTHPDRLITKEELMEAIWAPAVVTDGALNQCVIDVRRALDDHGHQIVRTVPRRGLRFGLSVTSTTSPDIASAPGESPADPAPATAPAYRLMLLSTVTLGAACLIWWGSIVWRQAEPATTAVGTTAVPLTLPPQTVILGPFTVIGDEAGLAAFAARTRNELVSRLSEMRSLNVALAERSGAGDAVLDVTVERRGDRLQTAVHVTHAGDGDVLWIKTFEQPLEQTEFAHAALVAFAVEGVVRNRQIGSRMPPHYSEQARREYAQGNQEWWLWALGAGGNVRVVGEHLRRAVQLEPRMWAAQAQLLIHYANRFELDQPLPDYVAEAHRAARALMALTANDAEYSMPVAWEVPVALVLMRLDLDLDYAERLLRQAKAKGFPPGQIDTELGRLYALRGDTAAASVWFQAAIDRGAEINQTSALADYASALLVAGQYERARELIDRAASMTVPGSEMHLYVQLSQVTAHYLAGDYSKAAEILDEALTMYGQTHTRLFPAALALLGRDEEARAILPEFDAMYRSGRLSQATTAMLANHYLGDTDQTFLWIDRAIEIRDHHALPVLHRSAVIEPLRQDPRFAEAMQRFAAIEAAGSPLRPDIDALREAQQ
jgi:DNA-binding winged helix-turn-helix (wHTH) protein/tetratricopeptide (TPR) repeat protein